LKEKHVDMEQMLIEKNIIAFASKHIIRMISREYIQVWSI